MVGSKKYGARSGRCLPPVSTRAPLATASSTWAADRVELRLRDQRAHVDAPVHAGAERHRLGPGHEPLHEPVVDLVGDEHPLRRDAQLAGVGEAGPDRALGGLLQVGVAQDQDRVLAAELQRAADQPLGAALAATLCPVAVEPVKQM